MTPEPNAETVDLAIVGGGITGAGLARLAARNGLSVTLVERGDLMSGASSRSSHMLHGGLRYLEHGHIALVREALHERAAVSRMAPALTRPCRFLVPLYPGDRVGPLRLRAGLAGYDLLAGRRSFAPHAMVRGAEAVRLEPALAFAGLRGAGLYTDVVMDDAQLGLAVVRDAAAHGARVHSWTEVVGARGGSGARALLLRDTLTQIEHEVTARVIVIAAGAWTDEVRRRVLWGLAPGVAPPEPMLRPSRGTHLVYPPLTKGHGLLILAGDGRAFFAIPFAGHTLVGTTEIEVASPPAPEAQNAHLSELTYLRDSLARVLPHSLGLRPRALFAGLRPLLHDDGPTGALSREHSIRDEDGVLSIAGGKYTTFRVMARDALRGVFRRLGRVPSFEDSEAALPAPPSEDVPLGRRVEWAVNEGFARRLEDVLRRRSHLWLADDRGRGAASEVARLMAPLLGWDENRERREVAEWDLAVHSEEQLLDRAGWPPA